MELSISSNVVTITGNIKSVSDFQKIKVELDELTSKHKDIAIVIVDSLSITSSVIGYFNKLVLKDHVRIRLSAGNDQLLELLNDLNLTSVFNVKKA